MGVMPYFVRHVKFTMPSRDEGVDYLTFEAHVINPDADPATWRWGFSWPGSCCHEDLNTVIESLRRLKDKVMYHTMEAEDEYHAALGR